MSLRGVYIAVHGGAGVHSHTREDEVKQALRVACTEGLKCIGITTKAQRDGTRLQMVENAVSCLEDNPNLNAGYGSNLTLHGTVECDAAIMDGRSGDFGSVGAVSGIKNPIRVARAILDYSKVPDPLGRIPPLTLVSEGAHAFAVAHCADGKSQSVPAESLIASRSKREWEEWKARLDRGDYGTESQVENIRDIQDTVGAVVCEGTVDGISAGVSSGGILLKHPGRIGEAAMFGAGCWAQYFPKAKLGIACSVSGAGESIVRATIARAIGDGFKDCISKEEEVDPHSIISTVVVDRFCGPCRDRGEVNLDVGIILLVTEDIENKITARLWCAFTTPSMAIAYASSETPKPKAQILRRPKSKPSSLTSEPHIFITAISL
ncbi:Threonine aspartase 1 [Hypsizygus marmoreus]|uniref:Threonine aspartase 1 n=1 Tax=Hypsizygus marmoreus TaxID=39966 RepID=A0A369JUA9_HYPMA|nr:Threonine aspartase 1 [Hypsizygus marmoreus]